MWGFIYWKGFKAMALNLGIDDKGLFAATRGTLFVADASDGEVALPTDLSQFSLLTKSVDSKWYNIGHTSNDNKITTSVDGGEATTHATWLVAAARTTYSDTKVTLTGKSVQGDKETVKFVYNGWSNSSGKGVNVGLDKTAQKLSLLILVQDEGAGSRLGVYFPNVSFTYDGFPDFSGDNFVEYGFTCSVLTSTTLSASPTGKAAAFSILNNEDFAPATAVAGTIH